MINGKSFKIDLNAPWTDDELDMLDSIGKIKIDLTEGDSSKFDEDIIEWIEEEIVDVLDQKELLVSYDENGSGSLE